MIARDFFIGTTEDCPVESECSPDETELCSNNGDVQHSAAEGNDLETKQDPTTPTKQRGISELHCTPDKLAFAPPSNKNGLRAGRPKGKALTYGSSLIEEHHPRGRAGHLRSNRLMNNQTRVQKSLPSTCLVPVVHAARKYCQMKGDRFEYGCIRMIKELFPSLALQSNTIRRCFFNGDAILEDAQMVSKLVQSGGSTRHHRKGIRNITTQGKRQGCLGPLAATRAWCHDLHLLQIRVPRTVLLSYFTDQLETHKQALETVLISESDHPAHKEWTHELNAIKSKLARLEKSKGARLTQIIHELHQSIQLGNPRATDLGRCE